MLVAVVLISFFGLSGGIQVTSKSGSPSGSLLNSYHNYDEMTQLLKEIAQNYSKFVTLESIGKSVENRELWVLKIGSPKSQKLGTPHVKLIGNIHGNEPVGRELILYLAQHLLSNYDTDEEIRWILDRTMIHLLPSMNPDGFEKSKEGVCEGVRGRANANGFDLNRNFPDQFLGPDSQPQPETKAIVKWLSRVPFLLSLSFHGGALVANYPYDDYPRNYMDPTFYSEYLTPDDDVFKNLALTYSKNHWTMHFGNSCDYVQNFPDGITNGAAWYPLQGGMQDYNYVAHGCMEITLEVSCCKYPPAEQLPQFWKENKEAIFKFIKKAQTGVRGLIQNSVTSEHVPKAQLFVSGREVPFVSSKNGEFWRVLLPGSYTLTVKAKGYHNLSVPFTVYSTNETFPTFTWLNVSLQPLDVLIPGSYYNSILLTSGSSSSSEKSVLFAPLHLQLLFFSVIISRSKSGKVKQ